VFSDRTPESLAPNRLARASARVRGEGRAFVDLTESNPTRAGFSYPADLLTPLSDAGALTYEPRALGARPAREAVASDYGRRGVRVSPERIVLTASTSEAYSILFKVLADAGDEVLIPRPSYPLFDHLIRLDALVPRTYGLDYHGLWSIDFEGLERALGPRTRAVLAVSPNNPTGSFVKKAEMDRLARVCASHGVALIVDEVFADYPLEPQPAADRASVLDCGDVLAFGLGGLSKSVGLPQVKLGWIGVAGPDALVAQAIERLELVCDTYLSVSTPVQVAAPLLLERGAVVREQIGARVRANYRTLKAAAGDVPSCRVLHADGGWYAVLQVPSLQTEEDLVVDLLESSGVLVHPGYFFDFPSESFLVVSLLVPEPAFERAARTLLGRFRGEA